MFRTILEALEILILSLCTSQATQPEGGSAPCQGPESCRWESCDPTCELPEGARIVHCERRGEGCVGAAELPDGTLLRFECGPESCEVRECDDPGECRKAESCEVSERRGVPQGRSGPF